MKVICNHSMSTCNAGCPHRLPHCPDKDTFHVGEGADGEPLYQDGYCSEVSGPCEWPGGFDGGPCLCVRTDDPRHKTTPARRE